MTAWHPELPSAGLVSLELRAMGCEAAEGLKDVAHLLCCFVLPPGNGRDLRLLLLISSRKAPKRPLAFAYCPTLTIFVNLGQRLFKLLNTTFLPIAGQ